MRENRIKRTPRKMMRDILGREAGIHGTSHQRGLAPAVERDVGQSRRYDGGGIRMYRMGKGTMKVVCCGHACPRVMDQSLVHTLINDRISETADFSSNKLPQTY